MHTFLRKISQLNTVREAFLLGADGTMLLRCQGGEEVTNGGGNPWPVILAGLGQVSAAELGFTKGCYCLRVTPVGLVVVGMGGKSALPTIRKALDSVLEKLADGAVCEKVVQQLLSRVDDHAKRRLLGLQDRVQVVKKNQAPVKTSPTPTPSGKVDPQEDQDIHQALQRGDKKRAVSLVMEKIAVCARSHHFERAERLRDWLLEIDSMALVEGIRAAELIEEEKASAIGPGVQEIWQELLKSLSREEFATLYHAGVPRSYADGEMVVRQGDFQAALYLVNSGQVQMTVENEGRQVVLRNYGPGDIFGGETFFDASVWTANVVSRGASLSCVLRTKLIASKESQPALYGKLQDYCGKSPSIGMLFQKSRRTRRAHERRKAQGRVGIDLLDVQGRETGLTAKGELLDLSRGGVALSLRFSKKKSAAALLGQLIRVHLQPKAAAQPLARVGKVMAVRCHDFVGNEYTLHVHFETELTGSEVLQLTTGG